MPLPQLDTRIILGAQRADIPTYGEVQADASKALQSRLQMEAATETLRASRQKTADTMAVRQVLQGSGGRLTASVLDQIRAISPAMAGDLEKDHVETRKKIADTIKVELDNDDTNRETASRLINIAIHDPRQYNPKQIAEYAPDLAQMLPATPDRATLTQLARVGEKYGDQIKFDRDFTTSFYKGDLKGLQQYMGHSASADEWNAKRALLAHDPNVPDDVLNALGEYSPEAAQALLMTAKEAADVETARRGQDVTARGQDISSTTSRQNAVLSAETSAANARLAAETSRANSIRSTSQAAKAAADQIVQTNEGTLLINKATGTSRHVTAPDGSRNLDRPDTSAMRDRTEARSTIGKQINAVQSLSKRVITEKFGAVQKAKAAGRSVEAALADDPDYLVYQAARFAMAGNLAVAQQGSRPSDADIKSGWLPMVPDAFTDTSSSADAKWDLIKTLSNAKESTAPGGPPPPSSGLSRYDRYRQSRKP